MDEDIAVTPRIVIPARELRERFSRSSGPGGQGVNTTDSRVELSFDIARSEAIPEDLRSRMLDRLSNKLSDGVLTIAAGNHRSQRRNREAARARLVERLREAAAPPPPKRRATKRSRGVNERRIAEKKRRGEVKKTRRRPPTE